MGFQWKDPSTDFRYWFCDLFQLLFFIFVSVVVLDNLRCMIYFPYLHYRGGGFISLEKCIVLCQKLFGKCDFVNSNDVNVQYDSFSHY
jgi:hypothetical protein